MSGETGVINDQPRDLRWPRRPDPADMEALAAAMTEAMFMGFGPGLELARLLERVGVCPRPADDRGEPPDGYRVTRFVDSDVDDESPAWGGWNIWVGVRAAAACVHDDGSLGFRTALRASRALAVRAAWQHHDDRRALARRLVDTSGVADVWPRCCGWSKGQIAAVERWLIDSTVERPDVLDQDDAPNVCGGCYAMRGEPCDPFCIDARINARADGDPEGCSFEDEDLGGGEEDGDGC